MTQLLTVERRRLEQLARALLAQETLDEEAAYIAAGVTRGSLASVSPRVAALSGGRRETI